MTLELKLSKASMKVVYLAGPFSAESPWEQHQNVLQAERASAEVAKLGAVPMCPHKNTEHLSGIQDEAFWYAATLELLRRCDAVLLVEGWEKSKGARGEREAAENSGLPRFYELGSLETWLKGDAWSTYVPTRATREDLERTIREVGPRDFDRLYLQKPVKGERDDRGACPNGCGALVLDGPGHGHCPVCGFQLDLEDEVQS